MSDGHFSFLCLQELDPYYPFEEAVDVWARTFAALGIKYQVLQIPHCFTAWIKLCESQASTCDGNIRPYSTKCTARHQVFRCFNPESRCTLRASAETA